MVDAVRLPPGFGKIDGRDHPDNIVATVARQRAIEECARFLQEQYPDNVNTNAFCAALRSLALSSKECK